MATVPPQPPNNQVPSINQHVPPTHVCIVGGGIIGTATAYYLATVYGIRTTIVDRTGTIAPAASGKAGGFLAKDWNDGTLTQQLTHRSFQLHETLADTFTPEAIQYRKLSCVAIDLASATGRFRSNTRKLQHVEWASTNVIQTTRTLGTEATIAQVHPKMLCERLWDETKQHIPSCQLVKGNVVETVVVTANAGPTGSDNNSATTTMTATPMEVVRGVKLDDGTMIEADAVLYACGPWNVFHPRTTGDLQTAMRGDKYHSLIVPTQRIYTQCVFFHGHGDPEVYVRPDQTAYCTGFPEPPRIVTEAPGAEAIEDAKISAIYTAIQHVTRRSTADAKPTTHSNIDATGAWTTTMTTTTTNDLG